MSLIVKLKTGLPLFVAMRLSLPAAETSSACNWMTSLLQETNVTKLTICILYLFIK